MTSTTNSDSLTVSKATPSLSSQSKIHLKQIQSLMRRDELPQDNCFEHFPSCQEQFDLIYDKLEHYQRRRSYRLSFDDITQNIVVRWMPSNTHEFAHVNLLLEIVWLLQKRLGMDYRQRYNVSLASGGKALKKFPSGGAQEADSCLVGPIYAPTLVIETGVPESLGELRIDAARWLEHPGSTVNLVILISLKKAHLGKPPQMLVEFHKPDYHRTYDWSTSGPSADVRIYLSEIFPPAELAKLPPQSQDWLSWGTEEIDSWRNMVLEMLH